MSQKHFEWLILNQRNVTRYQKFSLFIIIICVVSELGCVCYWQVMNTDPAVVHKHMGNDAYVSPIVVIEPMRRKFHKALTRTLPIPGFNIKKFSKKSVRILFSITGKQAC